MAAVIIMYSDLRQDTLLAYSRAQLERELPSGHVIGREYTISRMFSQYDLNNDGQLRPAELNQVRSGSGQGQVRVSLIYR